MKQTSIFISIVLFSLTSFSYRDVDVFVLGDSQITFSAHRPYEQFFGNLGWPLGHHNRNVCEPKLDSRIICA